MVRILVAGHHEVMRRGLRDLLLAHKGWTYARKRAMGVTRSISPSSYTQMSL